MPGPTPTSIESIADHVRAHHARAVERLERLVNHDTPSMDARANREAIAMISRWCKAHGATVEVVDAGAAHADHLIARWPARAVDGDQILILNHVDTVWPGDETQRRPFHRNGDRATGPGIFDMKCGIIQSIEAIDAARSVDPLERTSITLIVTSDEEVGSPTSRSLIEREALKSALVLVAEPSSDGALKTARKSVGMYEITAEGRAAHAGLEPEAGRSAILEMARQIPIIDALNDSAVGTTVTLGVIAGGSARNVVAERCTIHVDVRAALPEEAHRVHEALTNLQPIGEGINLHCAGGTNRPVMERTSSTAHVFARAKAIAEDLGEPLQETVVGGGSDGNFTAALGRPTLDGLGAVGGGAHAVHEWIDLPRSLLQRTSLLAGLLVDHARTSSADVAGHPPNGVN